MAGQNAGKGSTKSITDKQHEDTRRAKKASQNANARANAIGKANAASKAASSGGTKPPMPSYNRVDHSQEQAQRQVASEEQARKNAETQQKPQLQSDLAVTLINEWRMTDGARWVATAVAKAFVDARKDGDAPGDRNKTQVAKDMTKESWQKWPDLQAAVSKEDLEQGFRIAGAALRNAGNTVYSNKKKESAVTDA